MSTDKKCKDTKRLLKLAKESGMTNKDIAIKAGLKPKSISLVSRWLNDGVLATERQMRFFIKEFGAQLKRKSEHLLMALEEGKISFIKLTGDLIIKHTLRHHCIYNKKELKISFYRFLIFSQNEKFYIVTQVRKGFTGLLRFDIDSLRNLSHCDNEDANWVLTETPSLLSLEELIKRIDLIAKKLADGSYINDFQNSFTGQELQFVVRRHLMREGINLPNVIDISSQS